MFIVASTYFIELMIVFKHTSEVEKSLCIYITDRWKSSQKIIGKYLRWSSFFNKNAGCRFAILSKNDSGAGVSLWTLKFLHESIFKDQSWTAACENTWTYWNYYWIFSFVMVIDVRSLVVKVNVKFLCQVDSCADCQYFRTANIKQYPSGHRKQ